jgi:drug/metabolite transporter (DMT)-like permease
MKEHKNHKWLIYALTTVILWGIWGAFTEIPEKNGFPGTLIFVVWAITMIFPAIFILKRANWKIDHDPKAVLYGMLIGILGAGGQLILFTGAIQNGPAYLIFPIISLSPVITILLSMMFLSESASKRAWGGIILALISIPLLSYQDPTGNSLGYAWMWYALLIFVAWGTQAFFMKKANLIMSGESIFAYMTISGLLMIPIVLMMTDFDKEINMGLNGPYLAFAIQMLNSIGALTIVFAFRYGKAIIVSPLTNALAPVITIIISLIIYSVIPHPIIITGMVMAVAAIVLLANE